MAQQQNKAVTNASVNDRIEDDLALWRAREERYAQSFGPNLYQDKDFLKAKLDVLRDIHKQHNVPGLNKDERISHRILRGQIRQLRRRLQPKNVILRFLYNAARLVWNVIALPIRAGIAIARVVNAQSKRQPNYTLTSGITPADRARRATHADGLTRQAAAKASQGENQQKARDSAKDQQAGLAGRVQQQEALARKRLQSDRTLRPNIPTKGMKMG